MEGRRTRRRRRPPGSVSRAPKRRGTRLSLRDDAVDLYLAASPERADAFLRPFLKRERETLQLAVNDQEDEQARLVDLENQVAAALRTHENELTKKKTERNKKIDACTEI